MIHAFRILFLILIFLSLHLNVFAQDETSVVKIPPDQKESVKIKKLAKGADVILTGKVTQKKSGWNENKTRIYTTTTLEVDEYLKGKNNETAVEIISPGGEVGDVGEVYTHMPRFEQNEEVLVFLKKDETNRNYKVYNGEEGKMSVRNDLKTNEKVTASDLRIIDLKTQIKNYINEP